MSSSSDLPRGKPGMLFGTNLDDLIKTNKNPQIPVPEFLLKVYRFLKDTSILLFDDANTF
jgi:hypothetical protein